MQVVRPTESTARDLCSPIHLMNETARRDFERSALPLLDNMYGAALRLTRDAAEAEDLVQDTMVRAYRFWDKYKSGTNLKAWMFTILRNTFITRYHKRNRTRDLASEVESQLESLGPGVAVASPGSAPQLPDEAMSSRIEQSRILEALDSLPEDYRTAVTLADLQGLAYKEIAEIMGCPVGTVMSRIYRGRKILYKLLLDLATETGRVAEGESNPRSSKRTADTTIESDDDQSRATKAAAGAEGTPPVSLGEYRANRAKRGNA